MHIRYGYSLDLEQPAASLVTLILDVHPTQRGDITQPETIEATALADGAPVEVKAIDKDANGNLLRRYLAPQAASGSKGRRPIQQRLRRQWSASRPPAATSDLPPDVVPFLLPSRNCPEGELTERAWALFRHVPAGWDQVLAICDYLNRKLQQASTGMRTLRTAGEALQDGTASMDDFAHVAIAFCRALDIPARYCRGYLLGPRAAPTCAVTVSAPGSRSISTMPGGRRTRAPSITGSGASWWRAARMRPTRRLRPALMDCASPPRMFRRAHRGRALSRHDAGSERALAHASVAHRLLTEHDFPERVPWDGRGFHGRRSGNGVGSSLVVRG